MLAKRDANEWRAAETAEERLCKPIRLADGLQAKLGEMASGAASAAMHLHTAAARNFIERICAS